MRPMHLLRWRILLISLAVLLVLVLPSVFSPVLQSPFSVDRNAGGSISYADSDGDGIPDINEIYDYGTNPLSNDSDGDGMPDGWEIDNRQWIESAGVWTLNPTSSLDAGQDADNDGLPNYAEFLNGTSPNNPDTDGDGMPDGWEVFNHLNPLDASDAMGDMDSDGLTNIQEFLNHTDASNPDTDGDGLLDGSEVLVYHTSPLSPDTDGDGMPDGWEISNNLDPLLSADSTYDPDGDLLMNLGEYLNSTDPWNSDTDNDSMPDGWEVLYHFNPLDPSDAEKDADGDGLSNLREMQLGTDPRNNDTDGDSLGDMEELTYGTNPLVPDTDGEGILDGNEVHGVVSPHYLNTTYFTNATKRDTDGDGLTDYEEVYVYFTDPTNPDTDGDGLPDGMEVHPQKYAASPTNATNPDTDGDGIPDGWEYFNGQYVDYHWAPDPNNASDAEEDLDGDGLTNLQEFAAGTDPWNPDTDSDGMPDGWELHYSLNPLDPSDAYMDNDAAGEDGGIYHWVNLVEYQHNTDPNNPDTDFDGIIDPLDPYPNNQRSDAGWPYPWLMGTISPDTLLFNITTDGTTDALRYWKLASFDRYDGYWWYPSDTAETYDGHELNNEVSETYYPGTSHTYTVSLNNTLFSPTSSYLYMLPSRGIVPTALHTTWVNGSGLKVYPETGEFQSDNIPESYVFNATTYHLYQSDVETGSVPLFRTDLLSLPQVPGRVLDLSRNVTANYTSVYGKITAIRDYLRMNYRYNETRSPPPEGHDAVDWFLFNRKEGNSADFASAFALMARLNNIPTRVSTGFRTGTTTDGTNYSVRLSDLHFWDEVLFYNMGWVELDVTSPYFIGPGDGWPAATNSSAIAYPEDITPVYSQIRNLTANITYISDLSAIRGEGQIIVEGFVVDNLGAPVPSVPVTAYLNSSDGQKLLRLGSVETNKNGYYRAVCLIPWNASLGASSIVVRANGLNDGVNLRSYLPSWSSTVSNALTVKARLYIDISAPSSVFNSSLMPVKGTLTDGNLNTYPGFNISVMWDGVFLRNFVTNGRGNFNTTLYVNETAGFHYIFAGFNGTSLIYPSNRTVTITVRHNLTLTMDTAANTTSAGSNVSFSGAILDGTISPALVDDSVSGMWLIYEGEYVAHSDINSTGGFQLNFTLSPDTLPGVKDLVVYFPESNFYGWIYASVNLTVYGDCALSLEQVCGARNSTVALRGTIRNMRYEPLKNMTVTVSVNGTSVGSAVTTANGTFSVPYHIPFDTPGGSLNISANLPSQHYYFPVSAESCISVFVPTVIRIEPQVVKRGEVINISGCLETDRGEPVPSGNLLIYWNHMDAGGAIVSNGSFSLSYTDTSPGQPKGEIPVTVVFNGSGFYLNSTGESAFTVMAGTSLVFLPVDAAVAGENMTVSGRLYEDDLTPVPGARVFLEIAGENWTALTTANGTFVSTHTVSNVSAGHYTMKAYFNGSRSSYLLKSSADAHVVVREKSRLSIVLPDEISSEFNLRARLIGQQGEVMAGQQVVILTNRTYTAVTNSTGWIDVPVLFAGNDSGIMNITVMFNGTELYLPSVSNTTLELPVRNGGITGSIVGTGAIVFSVIGIIAVAILLLLRKNRLRALRDAMDHAVYQLEIRDDHHRVVFETYRHLIGLLKRYGYLKEDWQTVREFQEALRDALSGIREDNLETVFDIFEEARYSAHDISQEDVERIKAAFEGLRDDITRLMEERK